MSEVQERFRIALTLHQSGRADQAADIYREVLQVDPAHAGAWHLLGVVLHARGKLVEALTHIERALGLCDTKAVCWNNYGAVLKDVDRHRDAKESFERAIRIRVTQRHWL